MKIVCMKLCFFMPLMRHALSPMFLTKKLKSSMAMQNILYSAKRVLQLSHLPIFRVFAHIIGAKEHTSLIFDTSDTINACFRCIIQDDHHT